MRSEGSIRQKLKQAQFRHVKRVLVDKFPPGEDWSRSEVELVKEEYREFFSNSPIHVIAKDFPDVAALMWVLEDQPDGLIVGGSLVGRMGGVLLWADSEEEAEVARSMIDRIVEEATKPRDIPHTKTAEEVPTPLVHVVEPELVEEEFDTPISTSVAPVKRSWWKRIFG